MSLCYITGHRLCVVSWNGLGPCGREFPCAEISERIIWHLSCHIFWSHFFEKMVGSKQIIRSIYVSYWKWCPDMTISTIFIEAFQVFQTRKCNWCTHITIITHLLTNSNKTLSTKGSLELEVGSSLDTEEVMIPFIRDSKPPTQPTTNQAHWIWYAGEVGQRNPFLNRCLKPRNISSFKKCLFCWVELILKEIFWHREKASWTKSVGNKQCT